jgi:hypothetical protein
LAEGVELVFHTILTALGKSAALGTICLWAVISMGCGGGGESSTEEPVTTGSGVLLLNNPITFGGASNSHAIVSFSYAHGGKTGSVPLALPPGDHVFVPLVPGAYTLSVVFDDGSAERLQVPADQITVFTGEVARLRFLHA